jgi:hypothetical protein
LSIRIRLVSQQCAIVHDVPRVNTITIFVGDPLWSKPLLHGETNRDFLVIGVSDVPEKFVAILELDCVECSSHADVDTFDIIDWVNDVSLGLVLDERRQSVDILDF